MKKITLLLLSTCFASFVFSQTTETAKADTAVRKKKITPKTYTTKPSTAIYAEGGGNSIIYSLNYDMRFTKRLDGLGFRIGVGFFPLGDYNLTVIPMGINHLVGKNGNFVEIGVNVTAVSATTKVTPPTKPAQLGQIDLGRTSSSFVGGISMGYRYQPVNKHFNFRTGIETDIRKKNQIKNLFLQ
jgi:hypothetical protein